MTTTNNNRLLAAGSILLVAGLGIAYISFIGNFLEYAFNMFYLANKTTNDYLTIVPH
ncbi:MAG: hypothetical protein WCF67_06900 [Chitinophagaceae bacterium]